MNAKEFQDAYGAEVVGELAKVMRVKIVYWNNVKNGYTKVSFKQALKFSKESSKLVPPGAPHLTVLDMIGMSGESVRFIGHARGAIPAARKSPAKIQRNSQVEA